MATTLHIKLPPALKQALERNAAEQRRTVTATVILAIEKWLAEQAREKH